LEDEDPRYRLSLSNADLDSPGGLWLIGGNGILPPLSFLGDPLNRLTKFAILLPDLPTSRLLLSRDKVAKGDIDPFCPFLPYRVE
jgi:hypothetical protein